MIKSQKQEEQGLRHNTVGRVLIYHVGTFRFDRSWIHSPWLLPPPTYYLCAKIIPSVAPPATSLTLVAPNSKEGEDRCPVVSYAAQGQGCAIFVRERGTRGKPQRERTFPGPAWTLWPLPAPAPLPAIGGAVSPQYQAQRVQNDYLLTR